MESMHSANFPNNLGSSTQQLLTDTDLLICSGTVTSCQWCNRRTLILKKTFEVNNCAVETFGEFSCPFVPHDFVLIQEIITYDRDHLPKGIGTE